MNLRDLIRLLKSAENAEEIDKYRDRITELIPKTEIMLDYDQQNYAHQYDLWWHSLHTVAELSGNIDDDMVYLAALLHDIGKPYCRTEDVKDEKPNMHYYGHPEKGMQIVRDEVIPDLAEKRQDLSDNEKRRLLYYIEYHDDRVSLRMKHLRRHLKMGASLQEFQNLMKLQIADAKAHVLIPIVQQRMEICEKLSGEYGDKLYNDILNGK